MTFVFIFFVELSQLSGARYVLTCQTEWVSTLPAGLDVQKKKKATAGSTHAEMSNKLTMNMDQAITHAKQSGTQILFKSIYVESV